MPYIAPNTKVYILKGIPLDNTYEHTVAYSDANKQLTEFLKYKKFELEKLSYQRVGAGLMRVELKYEQMYDCNYMLFQNTSYGNKWWYAFITGVAYVNNTVCEISYEIDVMQTWCFDYEFMQSFVDREHMDPAIDRPENFANHNFQPEGLETGYEPLITGSYFMGGNLRSIMIMATETNTGVKQSFGMLNNYYTPLHVSIYDCGENFDNIPQAFYDEINGYVNNGKLESVMNICAGPSSIHGLLVTDYSYKFDPEVGLSVGSFKYKPKNSKLFMYPYHYYRVKDMSGNVRIYRPEYFLTLTEVHFLIYSYTYPQPSATVVPANYHSPYINPTLLPTPSEETAREVFKNGSQYGMTVSDYPTYAVANDSYLAWWAQNRNSYIATQNNITRSFNTEMANIGNSYAQQMASLKNSYGNSILQANTAYGNSMRSNQTALQNAGLESASTALSGLLKGGTEIASGFFSMDSSAVASGAGTIMQSAIQAATIDEMAKNTANSNYAINQANLRTAAAIGSNNFNSGKQIAELAKQSASLSALTNNQNATASLVAKKQDMMNVPDGSVGSISGSPVKADLRGYGFVFEEATADYDFLKMADDYFEKYGYKIAEMKKPSKMNNRPYWHYLQTTGCNIKGNFNDTDISAIKTIYNNGITTWNALENVGNYTLNNHTVNPVTTTDNNDN